MSGAQGAPARPKASSPAGSSLLELPVEVALADPQDLGGLLPVPLALLEYPNGGSASRPRRSVSSWSEVDGSSNAGRTRTPHGQMFGFERPAVAQDQGALDHVLELTQRLSGCSGTAGSTCMESSATRTLCLGMIGEWRTEASTSSGSCPGVCANQGSGSRTRSTASRDLHGTRPLLHHRLERSDRRRDDPDVDLDVDRSTHAAETCPSRYR